MNAILEGINSAGRAFVGFAGPMLVQSSVLIVILLIGDFVLRRKVRAVLRYWLWMLVLVKLVLPISLTTPVSLGQWFGGRLEYLQAEDIPAVVSEVAEPQLVGMEQESGLVEGGAAEVSVGVERLEPLPVREFEPAGTAEATEAAVAITPVTWEGWLFLGWLAGVVAMGLLLVQRAIFVLGLVAQARGVNGLMGDTLKYCCGRMGVKGEIGLKVSANATSPAVCGLFRPVILVPQDLGPNLGAGGLRVVLMHELAHIRRGDLWVNLVQTVLQIVYFYNPLLWAANAVIRRVREQAVDEAVQVAMGEKAGDYPETLVRVAKLAFERPALSLRLIGVVESKSTLQSRVRRMLERPLPKSSKLGFLGLVMILVVGAILLPMAKGVSGPPEFVIRGRVTAAETGLPIAGAKVGDVEKYADGKQFTTTDSDGNYSYLTWYEEHGIKAEAKGYKSEHKGLYTKLFGSEKEKVIDFALRQDGNRLEESKEKQFHVVWWLAGVEKEVYDQLDVIAQPVESQSKNYVGYSVDSEKLVGLISENRDVGNVIFTSKSKFLKPTSKYRIASSWADSGNLDHSVFVGYSTGAAGPYKLLQNGDNAKLELEHEIVSCMLNSGSSVQGAIFYDGDIKVDDSLVFAAKMPEKEASKPYHLVMYTGAMIEQEDAKIEDPIRYFHVKVVKKSSEYKATLTNGVTVELIGVCEHPSFGKQWWVPNGDLLEEAPYDDDFGRAFPRYGEKGYKFAVKYSGLDGKDVDSRIIPTDFKNTNGGGLFSTSENFGGEKSKYVKDSADEKVVWLGAAFDEKLSRCDIRIGVCWGKWKNKYKYETDKPNDAVEWVKFENVLLKPNFNPDVGLNEKEQIIKESESQARLLNHEYIGTEHILLALVAENSGIISDISKNFGITREAIYNETLKLVKKGKHIVYKKTLPMTPRAKLALKSANQLAKESNSVSVNSQHVLLGLLQVEDGVGAQVLMNLGLNLKKAAVGVEGGDENWTHIYPDGTFIKLVAVFDPHQEPVQFWDPEGKALAGMPEWHKDSSVFERKNNLGVVLGYKPEREGYKTASDGKYYTVRSVSKENPVIRYSRGWGEWEDIGTIGKGKVIVKDDSWYKLEKVEGVEGRNAQVGATMLYSVHPAFGIRLVIVGKDGKQYPMQGRTSFFGNFPKMRKYMYFRFVHGVSPMSVDYIVIQKQKMDWAVIGGFATELNGQVDSSFVPPMPASAYTIVSDNEDWKTIATVRANSAVDIGYYGGAEYTIDQPVEDQDYTVRLEITHTFNRNEYQVRMVGVEKNGNIVDGVKREGGGSKLKKITYIFNFAPLEFYKEFQFQIRPKNKDVSLEPKFKTDVQVEVEKAAEQSEFKATLPNGVTVELVGVCEYPDQKCGWSAAGNEIKAVPWRLRDYDLETPENRQHYAFVAQISSSTAPSTHWHVQGGWETAYLHTVNDSSGNKLEGIEAFAAALPEDREKTVVGIGVATVPWETIATIKEKQGVSIGFCKGGEYTIQEPTDHPDGRTSDVKMVDTIDRSKYALRMVAMTNSGETITSAINSTGGSHLTTTSHRYMLPLKQIKEFQLQTRPYEWVKFKDVSLKPDFKTAVGVEGGEVRVSGNAAVDIPTYSEIKEAIRSNYQARMELLENSSGAAEMFLEIRRSWLTKEGERRRGLKKAIWNTTWYVEGEKHRYDITIPAQEENNLYASQLVRPERVRAMVYPDRRVCYKVNENEVVIDKYLRTVGNPLGLSRFFDIRRLYKFNSRDYVLDSLTRWETKVEPEISEEMIGQIRCIKIMFDLEKANNWGRVEKWLLEFWLAPEQAYSLIKGQVLNNTGMEGTELKLLEGYEGRYRESKESDGVWLLEEVTITYNHIPNFGWERWKPGDGEKLKVKFVDKKVGVDIPEETFTLEALGIPDGTKVTDKLPGRLPREYIYYGGEIHEDSKSPSDPPGSEENSAVGIEGEKVPPPGRYALLFDGIDDYLEIDASESLQLGRHFTVQMWVKPEFPETSIPDKERNLLSKGGYVLGPPDEKDNRKTKPYGFGFKLIPEGESEVFLDVCMASHRGIYSSEVGFSKPSDWLHLAVVIDGNEGRVYRGAGFELSEESYEPAPKSNIIIGGEFLILPTGNYFKGQIGELRIWNRAMSFDEIAEFKTIALSGNEPNLVGCWTFEQVDGQHAIDISPYKNKGRLGSNFGVDNSDPTWVRIGSEKENAKNPDAEVEGGDDEVIQASELGAGAVSAEKGLQELIDAAKRGGTVIVPDGVYTEPVRISKSLKLKGQSLRGSVFEVTANEPAIFVDAKGKGRVSIEGLTIKWQLATSDKGIEHPFAVAVKDTKAEIKRCNFVPLGNPKRSPVAIRAMGFSELNIESCRFEGFEYVVCYGEGTEGVMSDSLIMDCGHQGVILYSGAKAKILRNVITGSRYHAVRSTGGTLDVRDNLLINNANRGIYLGNKSARGVIANNIIMGNGTGISGFAQSRVRIQNNIIADSSYAGISMRDSCSLSIRNNILQGNAKGCILHKEGSKNANKVFRNLFWQNEVDVENFDKPAVSISAEPGFADPENGDFSLKAGAALEHKQGLSDPNAFKVLWKRWKNRDDENEPFNVQDTKTDSDIESKEP